MSRVSWPSGFVPGVVVWQSEKSLRPVIVENVPHNAAGTAAAARAIARALGRPSVASRLRLRAWPLGLPFPPGAIRISL